MRFFFYGSLLDGDVTALVIGRRLPPRAWMPASLPGHARVRAKGVSYPVIRRDPRSQVRGAVVGGFSARDVARLSAYEGPRYRIAPLKVKIGGRTMVVSVFEPLEDRFEPAGGAWELAQWQRRDKRKFLERIRRIDYAARGPTARSACSTR